MVIVHTVVRYRLSTQILKIYTINVQFAIPDLTTMSLLFFSIIDNLSERHYDERITDRLFAILFIRHSSPSSHHPFVDQYLLRGIARFQIRPQRASGFWRCELLTFASLYIVNAFHNMKTIRKYRSPGV